MHLSWDQVGEIGDGLVLQGELFDLMLTKFLLRPKTRRTIVDVLNRLHRGGELRIVCLTR